MNDGCVKYNAKRHSVPFQEPAAGLMALGRRLEPEEIAPLAVYLASDAAAPVVGQAINIDGGVLMTG